ncbi:MAG TPA: Fic family protein [Solirubrobacteraceae bacterium]|nr:Fic family protein [Solirubrobacteraceae bacterium]
MHTFRSLDRQLGLIPASMALALAGVDLGRGREEAYRQQHPEALKTLIEIARIQSTEASNAIEQITAPRKRIEALVAEKTTPANRSEEEIAGYRAVLDTIHASAAHIPFKPSVVEQLHRDLYQFTNAPAGRWKTVENAIEEERADGTKIVRFRTVPAAETPAAMDELHTRFADALRERDHHPLLLIGSYVFDFLAIHPFRDGNGRIGRLLTLLALYQSGYEVGRFISLERLINDSKETYYDALAASGHGWHDDAHDIAPWLSYFLGILNAAHKEFESRVGVLAGKGAKEEAVRQFIRSSVTDEFTIAEIRQFAAGVSQSHLSKTLAKLRDEGIVEPVGAGRGARWRRLRSEF